MYLKVAVVLIGSLLALLVAGCPKQQAGSQGAEQVGTVAAHVEATGSKANELELASLSAELDKRAGITPEQNELILTSVLDAGHTLGLTYDQEYNVLRGKGAPESGGTQADRHGQKGSSDSQDSSITDDRRAPSV
jgi:hypothetical protein